MPFAMGIAEELYTLGCFAMEFEESMCGFKITLLHVTVNRTD